MKRACFTFGGILIALGMILSWLGYQMGGETTASVHLFGRTWNVGVPFSDGGYRAVDTVYAEATPIPSAPSSELRPGASSTSGPATVYQESETPFNSIYLDVDIGEVTIAAGDDYGVSIDCWGSGYRVESWSSNGQLIIESDGGSGFTIPSAQYGSVIIIYVPSNVALDSIWVDLDLGSLTLAGVTVHNVTADLDLGEFVGDSLTVLGTLDVDADLGDVTLYGQLGEWTEIDADLGAVTLGLSNPASDYSWSLEAELGSIEVDGRVRASNTALTGGNGRRWLEVEADLGSITVDFGTSNPVPRPPEDAQAEEGAGPIGEITYTFNGKAGTAVTEQSS